MTSAFDTRTVAGTLRRTLEILEAAPRVARGTWFDWSAPRVDGAQMPDCFCLVGAVVYAATGSLIFVGGAMADAHVAACVAALCDVTFGRPEGSEALFIWSDDHSHEEILAAVRRAVEHAEQVAA